MQKARKISLKAQHHALSTTQKQIATLSDIGTLESFASTLHQLELLPLTTTSVDILQVNMGKMCNQVCKHCHVDAGPDRKEIMTRATMQDCLEVLDQSTIHTIDLTGGAPEMNPHFQWFVEQLAARKLHISVRCNLTIILANAKYHHLPSFFKQHQVEVVASLPHFSATRTNAQRGIGVFEKSIKALQMLNAIGYGIDQNLTLNLVFNPSGAFLPADQQSLEHEFKRQLKTEYNIDFNQLFAITNLPIARFLDYLLSSGNYEAYMEKLVNAFNPATVQHVMCRNTLSVSWDGSLFDCDFNQMLDLPINTPSQNIKDLDLETLQKREIVLHNHCYGCTAGAGSSCGGATL